MKKLLGPVKIAALLLLFLLLMAACGKTAGEQAFLSSWTGYNTCQPGISVQGNVASCSLYVRARDHATPIEADIRLQKLNDGAWQTLKLWYGVPGIGELDFSKNFWLREVGEYRLYASVYAEGKVLQTTDVIKFEDVPPRDTPEEGNSFRKVVFEDFCLYKPKNAAAKPPCYQLPENDRLPIDELLATAEFAGTLGYKGVGGLKLSAGAAIGEASMQIPAAAVTAISEAMQQKRIYRLALGLPLGELWFLQEDSLEQFEHKDIQLTVNREINQGYDIEAGEKTAFRVHLAVNGYQQDKLPAKAMIRLPLTKAQAAAGEKLKVWTYSREGYEQPLLYAPDWHKDVAEGELTYVNILTDRPGLFILGCTEEEPAAEGKLTKRELLEKLYALRDTPDDSFADAADWALQRGILTGTDKGDLLLDEVVNRQDAALLMYRFVELDAGVYLPQRYKVPQYADRRSIRTYAREAVNTLVKAGVIGNKSEHFYPYAALKAADGEAMLERLARQLVLGKKDYVIF